jgi:hypothetical protein
MRAFIQGKARIKTHSKVEASSNMGLNADQIAVTEGDKSIIFFGDLAG